MNGTKLADDYDDLWDGTIDTPLEINENGDPREKDTHIGQPLVWTGTTASGLSFVSRELGTAIPQTGVRAPDGQRFDWVSDRSDVVNTWPLRLYGISEILVAPTVPTRAVDD